MSSFDSRSPLCLTQVNPQECQHLLKVSPLPLPFLPFQCLFFPSLLFPILPLRNRIEGNKNNWREGERREGKGRARKREKRNGHRSPRSLVRHHWGLLYLWFPLLFPFLCFPSGRFQGMDGSGRAPREAPRSSVTLVKVLLSFPSPSFPLRGSKKFLTFFFLT